MDALHQYFDGERSAGWLLAALGALALGFSWWLRASGTPLRAMLYPLAIVGAIELAVGVGLALKTPPQVAALDQRFAAAPADARAAERTRMEKVQRNFVVIKWVEVAAVLAGLALVMFGRGEARVGVGMGMVIQGGVMLAFDVFAEQRGALYLSWLLRGAGS